MALGLHHELMTRRDALNVLQIYTLVLIYQFKVYRPLEILNPNFTFWSMDQKISEEKLCLTRKYVDSAILNHYF